MINDLVDVKIAGTDYFQIVTFPFIFRFLLWESETNHSEIGLKSEEEIGPQTEEENGPPGKLMAGGRGEAYSPKETPGVATVKIVLKTYGNHSKSFWARQVPLLSGPG